MYPYKQSLPRNWAALATTLALLLGGCASKGPEGYGVAPQPSAAAPVPPQTSNSEQSAQIDTTQTYLDLIGQMQQAGQWYASLAHADAFEQQFGANPESRMLRADAMRNTGQFTQARQAYLVLLDGGSAARARRGLGLLHAAQGQYAQAVDQLEKARQLNPIDANVLSDLAYAHMLDGQLSSAQMPMLQAAQLAPGNARVQLNLALYWLACGNQIEASRLLQKLSQPPARGALPLIDQASLQTLQAQLAQVQEAVRARAMASSLPPRPEPAAAPKHPAATALPAAAGSHTSHQPQPGTAGLPPL